MKILSPTATYELERQTIDRQKITERDLMERAARAIFQKTQQLVGECRSNFILFCGPGNNGGDGLTLALLLFQAGHTVQIRLSEHDRYTQQNKYSQKALRDHGISILPIKLDETLSLPRESIIIDSLFGNGLKRPLSDQWSGFIHQINNLPNPILSIDIPSGLSAQNGNAPKVNAVHATYTFCISFPKLNVLLPENAVLCGNISILDIGLDKAVWETFDSTYHYTCRTSIMQIPRPLHKFAHKGTFGHVLLAGGSYGSIGAISLSCHAAQRTGCGIVTAYVPCCGHDILQISCPEALVQTDNTMKSIHTFSFKHNSYEAIAIGMGLGTQQSQSDAFFNFITSLENSDLTPPIIFDADAINILAKRPEIHHLLPPQSILTPHPKELKRLLGSWSDDHQKLEMARNWCAKYKQIMVIKGAHSAIVLSDGNIHFNSNGNPGMATAGSGDVLSGIIASLLAQRYAPHEAAILGVYLHGLAGDLAALQRHPRSVIASDITDHIAEAWKQISPYQLTSL